VPRPRLKTAPSNDASSQGRSRLPTGPNPIAPSRQRPGRLGASGPPSTIMGDGGKGPTASSTTPWTGAEPELFQFVLVEGLSADNNLAERSIRPLVVVRKISGGSRSEEGTKTRMALVSLFETRRVQGLNLVAECLRLLSQSSLPSTY